MDDRDSLHMRRCLELAAEYRGRTAPNPVVGCVITRNNRVLAEGVHRGPGTLHAEADALAKLHHRAPGATLYVNLEPCMHHGRTPPCMPAVRDAGIARLVYGSADPIRGHGGGAAALRRAGVVVDRARVDACDAAHHGVRSWGRHARPAFTLKAGITLDGKIATAAGRSKWITGVAARRDAMRERAASDAIVAGIGTVLADRPRLDVRGVPRARDPLRVILDTALRTPRDAPVLPGERAIATRGRGGLRDRVRRARAARARARAARPGRRRLAAADRRRRSRRAAGARPAPRRPRHHVRDLVEGGGAIHAAMLTACLADRVLLYIAPIAVGGPAPSWVGGAGVAELVDAYRFAIVAADRLMGGDLRVELAARPGLTSRSRSPRSRSRAP